MDTALIVLYVTALIVMICYDNKLIEEKSLINECISFVAQTGFYSFGEIFLKYLLRVDISSAKHCRVFLRGLKLKSITVAARRIQ